MVSTFIEAELTQEIWGLFVLNKDRVTRASKKQYCSLIERMDFKEGVTIPHVGSREGRLLLLVKCQEPWVHVIFMCSCMQGSHRHGWATQTLVNGCNQGQCALRGRHTFSIDWMLKASMRTAYVPLKVKISWILGSTESTGNNEALGFETWMLNWIASERGHENIFLMGKEHPK